MSLKLLKNLIESLIGNLKDIKSLNEEQQQKILLGILSACIVLVLYYYLLLAPKMSQAGRLFSEAGQVREEVLSARDDIARQTALQRRLKDLEEAVLRFQKAIPAESDLSRILNYLSNEAKAARISLLGVEPTREARASGEPFEKIRLLIRAKGSYHAFGTFLNRLESGERFIGVEAFDIVADPKSPMEHQIQLYLRTYVGGK